MLERIRSKPWGFSLVSVWTAMATVTTGLIQAPNRSRVLRFPGRAESEDKRRSRRRCCGSHDGLGDNTLTIQSIAAEGPTKRPGRPAVETSVGSFVKQGEVEVTMPLNATDSVASTKTAADGDVTIKVGTGASSETRGVLAADGTVVYDTDSTGHTVQATDDGFRIHSVIADAAAPTEITHEITLPAGANLVAAKDMPQSADAPAPAGAVFVVDANGTTTGAFMSPWAKDANGQDVATHYEIKEGNLVQIVEHNTSGIAYPVVADPQFGWVGWFPVVKFNRFETQFSTTAGGVLKMCSYAGRYSPVTLWACAISAGQIALQAVVANWRGECIQIAPAPFGAMAFRYTGGYCR